MQHVRAHGSSPRQSDGETESNLYVFFSTLVFAEDFLTRQVRSVDFALKTLRYFQSGNPIYYPLKL